LWIPASGRPSARINLVFLMKTQRTIGKIYTHV
jgi:hypothetical protein